MIYAIRAVGTDFIKFGRATHVGRRLSELDMACPLQLELISTVDWPNRAEKKIHRLLKHQNEKGEWFRDCELAQRIIGWMQSPDIGLARLQHESGKSLEDLAHALIAEPTASEVLTEAELRIERRRLERETWWEERNCRDAQTTEKA